MQSLPSIADDARLAIAADARWREVDGEVVILHIGSGEYFGLSESAAEAWRLIAAGADLAAIRARLGEIYDVDPTTLARDLADVLRELLERGLIVIG